MLKLENLCNMSASKRQTDKSRYPSKYSPRGYVTEAQYIIEIICEHKAKSQNQTLVLQFWKDKEWGKFFQTQLRVCHKLLNKYKAKAIINALVGWQGKKIFSLHAPWLEDIIKVEQKKLDVKPKVTKNFNNIKTCTSSVGRQPNKSKLGLNLLKDLDD